MPLGTQSLLVATDFSQASELAIDAAGMLARQFGATVYLVHVFDPTPMAPVATRGDATAQVGAEQDVETRILEGLQRLGDERLEGVKRIEPVVLTGASPADEICKYAAKKKIDMIVVSTHGRTGLAHLLIGSVAEKIVRHAPCPVLTLRTKS